MDLADAQAKYIAVQKQVRVLERLVADKIDEDCLAGLMLAQKEALRHTSVKSDDNRDELGDILSGAFSDKDQLGQYDAEENDELKDVLSGEFSDKDQLEQYDAGENDELKDVLSGEFSDKDQLGQYDAEGKDDPSGSEFEPEATESSHSASLESVEMSAVNVLETREVDDHAYEPLDRLSPDAFRLAGTPMVLGCIQCVKAGAECLGRFRKHAVLACWRCFKRHSRCSLATINGRTANRKDPATERDTTGKSQAVPKSCINTSRTVGSGSRNGNTTVQRATDKILRSRDQLEPLTGPDSTDLNDFESAISSNPDLETSGIEAPTVSSKAGDALVAQMGNNSHRPADETILRQCYLMELTLKSALRQNTDTVKGILRSIAMSRDFHLKLEQLSRTLDEDFRMWLEKWRGWLEIEHEVEGKQLEQDAIYVAVKRQNGAD